MKQLAEPGGEQGRIGNFNDACRRYDLTRACALCGDEDTGTRESGGIVCGWCIAELEESTISA